MSPMRRSARLRDDVAAIHGLCPRRRPVSLRARRPVRPRPTNMPASPPPAPARCGWKMPARVAGQRHRLSGGGRRHADVGRKHRQSDGDRRRPRSQGSRRRRRRLHDRFAHHCVDKALHIAGRGSRHGGRSRRRGSSHVGHGARGSAGAGSRRRHPALAGHRVRRDGRYRRGRSAAEIAGLCRDTAPGSTSTAPMAACSPVRRGPRAARAGSTRPTASPSIRTRPCSCPTAPARRSSATAGTCRCVQRDALTISAARRVRGRAIARRPLAGADPPFPRAAPVAAAAARRGCGVPCRPGREARARPLFSCAG